jgi:hypothetical protein
MLAREFVDPVNEWLLANKIEIVDCEIPVVNTDYGYAGLCDCVAMYKGEKVVIDWKTTKTTEKTKASQMPWDSHPTQIAAYSMALFGEIPDHGINVYISTTELDPKPRVEAVIWDRNKLLEEWKTFVTITKVWQARKGYTPPGTLTENYFELWSD